MGLIIEKMEVQSTAWAARFVLPFYFRSVFREFYLTFCYYLQL